MSGAPSKSLMFVQNGDYREAYARLKSGGAETYRDQKRSVDYVVGLSKGAKVTTVAFCDTKHHEEIAPDLWSVGLSYDAANEPAIKQIFDQISPTHVILRTPHLGFLREARRRAIPVLPNFADIFERGGLRTTLRNFRMRRELLKSRAPCFCNHSLNASQSLIDILKLPAEKVIPWDWSKVSVGETPRKTPSDKARSSAFFAGALSEEKGVGDCLEAVALLKAQGVKLDMRFAGPGDIAHWQKRSEGLGIEDRVAFLGMIANADVRAEMGQHDFVIVPSRPSYAEGLPNTIYEGLASRSVLILSDHPAFAGRLVADQEVLIFKAADPGALARSVLRAMQDSALYETLSRNSAAAHDRLYIGMEWTSLVDSFLTDAENQHGWVEKNTLQHWQ